MSAPPFGAERLIQLPDVFHDDAFVGTPAHGHGAKGERKLVWYLEDCCGNIVASVSDDQVQATRERWGFDDAHVVAYQGGAP